MGLTETNNNIHFSLRRLIELKCQKDNSDFTIYKLAQNLSMPHSVLIKLMHEHPEKRVNNPRIETLDKIVTFFRKDGFNITIDDLLHGIKNPSYIDVIPQEENLEKNVTIPLFDINQANIKVGTIDVTLESGSTDLVAFSSNNDMGPFFKKGSIFIADKSAKPEHDSLVAVDLGDKNSIQVKKYCIEGHKRVLYSLSESEEPITILPTKIIKIIGVIVQVNAKT
jgi:hypothetical protein